MFEKFFLKCVGLLVWHSYCYVDIVDTGFELSSHTRIYLLTSFMLGEKGTGYSCKYWLKTCNLIWIFNFFMLFFTFQEELETKIKLLQETIDKNKTQVRYQTIWNFSTVK